MNVVLILFKGFPINHKIFLYELLNEVYFVVYLLIIALILKQSAIEAKS